MVSCKMFKLLQLIPELQVKSFDYDKFMKETVAGIWKQISASTYPPLVLAEAYTTLSQFSMDCHVLKQLPAAVSYVFVLISIYLLFEIVILVDIRAFILLLLCRLKQTLNYPPR